MSPKKRSPVRIYMRTRKLKSGRPVVYWQGQRELHDVPGSDRVRITVTCKRRGDVESAIQEREAEYRAALAKGQNPKVPDPGRRLLRDAIEAWNRSRRVRGVVSESTAYRQASALKHAAADRVGSLELGQVTAPELRAMHDRLAEAGLGERTRKILHQALRLVLEQAVEDGVLASNPCDAKSVRPGRTTKSRVVARGEVWSADEVQRLIEASRAERLGSLVRLLLWTGLRGGEARGLQWADVDEGRAELHVRRALKEHAGRLVLDEPKTASAVRTVPLTPEALADLRQHRAEDTMRRRRLEQRRAEREEREPETIAPPSAADLVFVDSRDGNPVRHRTLSALLSRVCEAADVPRRSPHAARHTFVSSLVAAGQDLAWVSRLAGHASPAITAQLYTHWVPRDDAPVRARLASLYKDIGGGHG